MAWHLILELTSGFITALSTQKVKVLSSPSPIGLTGDETDLLLAATMA